MFFEVRKEIVEALTVRIGDETTVISGQRGGVSVRVLENGAWGFAATNDENANVNELLDKAKRLAELGGGSVKITKGEKITDRKVAKIEWADSEEMFGLVKDAQKKTRMEKIATSTLSLSAKKIKKIYSNSNGSEIEQEDAYFYFACNAIAKDGKIVSGSETAAKRGSYKEIDFDKVAETAAKSALTQLIAKTPPKGKFTVVLDPRMTGTFIHEAVGHAAEADAIVAKESTFCGKFGKRVGNELVNIYDDPTLPYFGGYEYDDEGCKAKRAVLIEKGMLVGFMNSNETAAELNIERNGHARADGYNAQPLVRMSCTIFKPGNDSDIFDIKEGVYVKGSAGGSVDVFSGGFMFKAKEGNMIRNGEIAEPLRDIVLIGNINEVLNNIEAVGKDFATHPGICGKNGQHVFVEDGGPHIRVKELAVG